MWQALENPRRRHQAQISASRRGLSSQPGKFDFCRLDQQDLSLGCSQNSEPASGENTGATPQALRSNSSSKGIER